MDKKEILEKLARNEITSEEAELLLAESGGSSSDGPVYEETWAEQKPVTIGNRGCLIMLITGIIGFILFIVLGAVCFLGVSGGRQAEAMKMHQQAERAIQRQEETHRIRAQVDSGEISDEDAQIFLNKLKKSDDSAAVAYTAEEARAVGFSPILIIIGGLILLVVLGVGAVFVIKGGNKSSGDGQSKGGMGILILLIAIILGLLIFAGLGFFVFLA